MRVGKRRRRGVFIVRQTVGSKPAAQSNNLINALHKGKWIAGLGGMGRLAGDWAGGWGRWAGGWGRWAWGWGRWAGDWAGGMGWRMG